MLLEIPTSSLHTKGLRSDLSLSIGVILINFCEKSINIKKLRLNDQNIVQLIQLLNEK